MAEIENLQVTITANATDFERGIEAAKNKLIDLNQQAKILKQGERDIQKALQESAAKYGEDSKQVQRLKNDLVDNARAQMDLKDEIKAVNTQLNKQQSEFRQSAQQGVNMGNQLKGVFIMLKGLAVGYAGKTLFEALIGSNTEFEQSMVSFEVLLQSAEKADALMANLENFAAKTLFEMTDLTQASQQLLTFGTAEDEVMTKLQQLGDLSQGVPEKLNRITLAYGKMNAKGKVSLEELNMLTEAGVPIVKELADMYNVSQETLYDYISKGRIGVEAIDAAFENLTASGGQFFGMMEKQSQTTEGMWSTMTDNVNIFAREVGEEAFETLKVTLSEVLDEINALEESGQLSAMAQEWGQNIGACISWILNFVQMLWNMRGVIGGVVGAMAAFKAGLMIVNTVNSLKRGITTVTTALTLYKKIIDAGNLSMVRKNLETGKMVLLENTATGAIQLKAAAEAEEAIAAGTATVAQQGLNAAMMANPILLVVGLLSMLIGSIVSFSTVASAASGDTEDLNKKMQDLKSSHESAIKSIDDTTNSKMAELNVIEKQIPRLEELNNKTNRTAEEEAEFKSIVDQTADALPNLGLEIDSITGKLNVQIGTIKEAVEAYRALAKAQALQDKIVENEKAIIEQEEIVAAAKNDQESWAAANSQHKFTGNTNGIELPWYAWIPDASGTVYNSVQSYIDGKVNTTTATVDKAQADLDKLNAQGKQWAEEVLELLPKTEGTGRGSGGSNTPPLRAGSGGSSKKSSSDSEAKKAEQELQKAIKREFQLLENRKEMGWISEEEYWAGVVALRDQYYQQGSDDWWTWTLKLNKKEKEARKQQFSDYISDSNDYINRCEENGWGTDSEVEAYRRRGERIRQFQQDYIQNESLTAVERNELWAKADEELYKNDKKLKDALLSEHKAQRKDSDQWIEDRNYWDDWDKYGDSEVAALERVIQRTQEDFQNQKISFEEYEAEMRELERSLAEAKEDEFDRWEKDADQYLEDRNLRGDWSKYEDDEARFYTRKLQRLDEYLAKGQISWKKYNEKKREYENDFYSLTKSNMEDLLDSTYSEMEKALRKMESDLQTSWNVTDRAESLEELQRQEAEFRGAVTAEGREEYERITDEIKKLNREEELYQLQLANAEKLERWENSKDGLLRSLLDSSESMGADLSGKLKDVLDKMNKTDINGVINAIVGLAESNVKQTVSSNFIGPLQPNQTYNNTANINQYVTDKTDAEIFKRSMADLFALGYRGSF